MAANESGLQSSSFSSFLSFSFFGKFGKSFHRLFFGSGPGGDADSFSVWHVVEDVVDTVGAFGKKHMSFPFFRAISH